MIRPSVRTALAVLLFVYGVQGGSSGSVTLCAFVLNKSIVTDRPPHRSATSSIVNYGDDVSGGGTVLADNRTMRCDRTSDSCYALWTVDPLNLTSIAIIGQGCWGSSGKCSQLECVVDQPKAINNTKFCCCAGDMCNANVTDNDAFPTIDAMVISTSIPDSMDLNRMSYGTETVIITSTSAVAVLVLVTIVILTYRRWINFSKPSSDSVHLMESSPPPPSPTLDLDNLKLIEMVGHGRYGCVWRGTLDDKEVAAKVFAHQHRQYYLNEKDIYGLAFMDHPSITKFIGADERSDGVGNPFEYFIVMAHAPCGCLQDYLRRNTIDWHTLCRMTTSIAKGVAHLHTDIRKGTKVKPCISHRDINSRNVLVKMDLSCALCDMGFAMKIAGSKYYGQNGEEQHAETTSLTDVGTLRYMAPEVLEGAVNLRDCESSLKQIDVYAMGLVLWEVASRCGDLYQGTEVSEYKLPFQNEIGLHPTFEQMQVLVSRHKARPLFPEVWKDNNLAIRLLKETIEDCWDQDAEARLTALCVEERLHELPNLWERHKANLGVSGVSPTVNPTTIYNHNQQPAALPTAALPATANHHHAGSLSDSEMTDRNANIVSLSDVVTRISTTNSSRASLMSSCKSNTNESSVSEQTNETFLTLSPSSELPIDSVLPSSPSPPLPPPSFNKKGASNQNNLRHQLQPLQPHQGRNPCMERNMIMEPLEEITVSGNRLLDKRQNDKGSPRVTRELSPEQMGGLFDALTGESNALITNDVLEQTAHRSSTAVCHHPIPYVQNAVHSTLPVCPKQPNIPGNGHSHHHASSSATSTSSSVKLPKKGAFRFERKRRQVSANAAEVAAKNNKTCINFRSLLFDWTKAGGGASVASEEETSAVQHRMATDALNTEKSNLLSHRNSSSNHNHNHSQLQKPRVSKVQTRVCLTADTEHFQPQTTVTLVSNALDNQTYGVSFDKSLSPEVGVARLHVPNGPAPIHVVQSRSRVHPPPLPPSASAAAAATPLGKCHRPKSLSITNGHHLSSVDHASTLECAPVKQRIKTPFKLKCNRLSLCDDRMMSTTALPLPSVNTCKSFSSVPGNMSSVCSNDFLTVTTAQRENALSSPYQQQQPLAPPLLPLPATTSSSTQQQTTLKNQTNGSVYQVSCI